MAIPFSHWLNRWRGADPAEVARRRLERYDRRLAARERRTRGLRRRWPALGEAADHPLTAVFATRRPKTRLGGCGVAILAYVAVSVIQVVVFSVGIASGSPVSGMLWLVASGILVLGAPFLYSRWVKHSASLELDRLFAPGNKDILLNLWLAPVSYGQLLAMEAGRIWLQRRYRTLVVAALLAGLAGWLYYVSLSVAEALPKHLGERVLFFGGVAAFLLSFLGFCDDLLLRGALVRWHSALRDMRQYRASLAAYLGRILAIVAVVSAGIALLIFQADAAGRVFAAIGAGLGAAGRWIAAEPYWRLGLYLFALAGGITAYCRTRLPRKTDALFLRLAKRGEALYRGYVQSLSEET